MKKSEKKALAAEIEKRLCDLYPSAECALEYNGDPWKLLVMGRLSAQCTDKRVNIVCRELFEKFPTAEDLANGDINEIERIIKPAGLFRMKANNIKEASRMLISDFMGIVPDNMDDLLRLPGVGRKIANLLLGDVWGKPAIVCDTHCIRICGRLGLYPETLKDPVKIEKILKELIEPDKGSDFCHRIVIFGREICEARTPRCENCPMQDVCKHRGTGK